LIRFVLALSFFYSSFLFAEEASGLGRADIILSSDLTARSNTVYAEIGRVTRSSSEARSYMGYGMYISSWLVCTDLCHFKMAESSPERRMLPKGFVVSLNGMYREYDQDGYKVQEFLVDSPKEILSVICYSHCDGYRSLMGVPEKSMKVSSRSGSRITLEGFKHLLNDKANLKIYPLAPFFSVEQR
jgi:hypothetical protein